MINNIKMKLYRLFHIKATFVVGLIGFLLGIFSGVFDVLLNESTDGDVEGKCVVDIAELIISKLSSATLFFAILFVLIIASFKHKGFIKNIPAQIGGIVSGTIVDVIVAYVILFVTTIFSLMGLLTGAFACILFRDDSWEINDISLFLYRLGAFLLLELGFILFLILISRICTKQVTLILILITLLEILPIFVQLLNMYLEDKDIIEKPHLYELITATSQLHTCEGDDFIKIAISACVYIVVFFTGILCTRNKDQL